jgi:hypothetical protein
MKTKHDLVMEPDEILTPPVGKYRTIWAGGSELHWCWKPIYAAKITTIPNPMLNSMPERQRGMQVLTLSFPHRFEWVNVNRSDVVLGDTTGCIDQPDAQLWTTPAGS